MEQTANNLPTFIRRWHWALVAVLSVGGIFYGSLLPFAFQTLSFSAAWESYRELLSAGPAVYFSRQDVAVNVLIAVPLAFSLMGALLLRCRSLSRLAAGTVVTLGICLAVSLSVEFAQLWVMTRVSSVRDVAAQFTGAAAGCVLWLLFGPALSTRLDEFIESRERTTRIIWLLNAYVIGLVIWSLLPFDFATNLNQIVRKYQHGQIELIPFTFVYRTASEFWYALLTDAAVFIPVGCWSVAAWNRKEATVRNLWSALLFSLGVAVGIELLQLLIRSRYTSTCDALMGLIGSAVGIGCSQIWLRFRGRAVTDSRSTFEAPGFWIIAWLLCAVGLLALNWMPYHITRDPAVLEQRLRSFVDLPFRTLQRSQSDVNALFHIIRNFAWYVPLGGLTAIAALRCSTRSRLRFANIAVAVLSVAAIALAGELGRILFSEKTADLTDALIRTAGGIAGLTVTAVVVSRWKPH